ncbi:MAG: hypothetical protein ACK4F9_01190 [Brevinematia bacterium]
MNKIVLLITILFFIFSGCSTNDKESKKLEEDINSLLSQIVVELKTPQKVTLSPRTFIELNAILIASNYLWTKELIKSETNISSEMLEKYREVKRKELLSMFGITIEDFENYSIKNYQSLKSFSDQNPNLMEKYNELSRMLPTLFENY